MRRKRFARDEQAVRGYATRINARSADRGTWACREKGQEQERLTVTDKDRCGGTKTAQHSENSAKGGKNTQKGQIKEKRLF